MRGKPFRHGVGLPGHHLGDAFDGVLPVTRVDAFGRVAEEEIDPAAQSGRCRERGADDLLGRAGIDRAFQDHDRARRHRAADRPAGGAHGRQIGDLVAIDWGRDGDDVDVMADQERAVGGQLERRRAERCGGDFPGSIVAGAQLAELAEDHDRSRSPGHAWRAPRPAAGQRNPGPPRRFWTCSIALSGAPWAADDLHLELSVARHCCTGRVVDRLGTLAERTLSASLPHRPTLIAVPGAYDDTFSLHRGPIGAKWRQTATFGQFLPTPRPRTDSQQIRRRWKGSHPSERNQNTLIEKKQPR